jgi:RNA polymerase sigma-70 factor (ECF subfamily)
VENLAAWLTTVVSRVCLNLLRAAGPARGGRWRLHPHWLGAADEDRIPQEEAELADSVGLAMLVVLNRLSPAGGSRSSCTTCSTRPSTTSRT